MSAFQNGGGGESFMDYTGPAPRAPRAGEPRSFNNGVPGSSPFVGQMPPPIARFTPTGYAERGSSSSGVPPVPYMDNPVERMRGLTGIISPPPPFASMIAPH